MMQTSGNDLRQDQIKEGRRLSSGTGSRGRSRSQKKEATGHEAFLKGLEASGGEIEVVYRDKDNSLIGRVKRSDAYTVSVEASGTGLTHIVFKHSILELIPMSKAPRARTEVAVEKKEE